MQRTSLTGFFMLLAVAGCAWADPVQNDDSNWLRTMAFAAHRINFSGVFVHQAGGNIEMSRITHVTDDEGEYERLQGLNGSGRELIRSNDQVWFLSDGKKVRSEPRKYRNLFPALLPEQISALKENYLVKQEEEDEVAGYHAHTVAFYPRDNLRYSRKMWAHSENGLLLKAAVLESHGFIIEQQAFVQLDISGNFDRSWIIRDKQVASGAREPIVPSSAQFPDAAGETDGWQVDFLPKGFRKVAAMLRTFHEKRDPVMHLVYSDGLAGISIFIENISGKSHSLPGLTGQGATHVYSRMLDDSMVTVIGEVPARTVIMVAESVRRGGS